jgi:hypothetical protein
MRLHGGVTEEPLVTGTKLPYKLGIELTMQSPLAICKNVQDEGDRVIYTSLSRILSTVAGLKRIKSYGIDRDGGCVEASSPILTTHEETEKWYKGMSGLMLQLGMTPHHDKMISGGGHLHVGPLPLKTAINCIRDMQNRPYLLWIFNEPDNTLASDLFTGDLVSLKPSLVKAAQNATFDPTVFGEPSMEGRTALTFYGNPKYVKHDWLPDDKNRMARWLGGGGGRMELRLFEAPMNWEEQKAHLDFTWAYIKYIETTYKTEHAVTTVNSMVEQRKFTLEICRAEFLKFLTILGLKPEPYKRMLDENLTTKLQRLKVVP